MRRRPITLVLAATALALAACAPQEESTDTGSTGGSAAATGACTPDELDTLEPGTLTIATDQPAYEPWFVDDTPENGQGFESAVAYAVAEQLGYAEDDVTWTRVPFNAAIQPGPRPFDVDVNQFSITEERRQAVDFSSPYYTVSQAVITTAGSAADGATSTEELRGLRLGAQVATTSLQVLTDVIAPESDPVVFNTNDDAKLALQNGQVDAIVVDLPTAFFITAAELDDGVIVGQLEDSGEGGDQFGLLLAKDSPLTDCVSQAVDALREDGTLADLEQQWLSDVADAPVLS
ncbi:polar amino acid transport system substrate-binding protein [Geodermatophilus dictyosporus]|uniref:Polar amino acid transport system substrate-binding protein n=1 Tax=Geodermatophilus dictyosporus TaxID=1523247 RepID=A0A1I5PBX6_9ACTN|nr:transporter substrate-binding domain-containing protein [Geodermatophilus dictyosporus]SFP31602.1 polar amino acid transport system substrate-binding protein [Geodermatophilus dictyosporus]